MDRETYRRVRLQFFRARDLAGRLYAIRLLYDAGLEPELAGRIHMMWSATVARRRPRQQTLSRRAG